MKSFLAFFAKDFSFSILHLWTSVPIDTFHICVFCLQKITKPESDDKVVWHHEEDKKEDHYTWFSTGTDLATDCEPVKSETDWES